MVRFARVAWSGEANLSAVGLVGGTQRDNLDDKVRKNRQASGSHNGRSKLNEAVVREIKCLLLKEEVSQAEIARRFGVLHYTIRDIKSGRIWSHIAPLQLLVLDGVELMPNAAQGMSAADQGAELIR